ncbi:hypothetical protein CH267_15870 [Rhodococcus sp. 06-621-2]|nr:IclR family transcriptional regulator C-terminal domain-containing protein [Rhodococcus sp. 06-621-2]OZC54290.1 hypothetical protein CH267_15870 [Rhodococcus sp. 06-621-2]
MNAPPRSSVAVALRRTSTPRLELVTSPLSPITDADLPRLRSEIDATAARGWSQDAREFDESSCCCGAPIFDHTGAVIAAISVAGVAERMEHSLDTVGPLVRKAADTISAQLGHVPPA